jgi:hypothetical protein
VDNSIDLISDDSNALDTCQRGEIFSKYATDILSSILLTTQLIHGLFASPEMLSVAIASPFNERPKRESYI